MKYKYESIDVRISRRTLWVGTDVYPLPNVARVQAREEILDRGRLTWLFAKRVAKPLVAGAAVVAVLWCGAPADPGRVLGAVGLVLFGLLLWHTSWFVRELTRARLYFLVVETAGTPRTAVVSTDRALIFDLADKVVEAIDNPAVDYSIRIDNIVLGDQKIEAGVIEIGGGRSPAP